VKLSTHKLQEIGVSRQAAYRALVELERHKLLSVERKAGRCPVVTLIVPRSQQNPAISTKTRVSRSATPV
jgi:DNA-binding GntR family transcriptional regulator